MTSEEMEAIEVWALGRDGGQRVIDLADEIRRLQAEQEVLKTLAKSCRSYWAQHPGDHVVRDGISKQGEAILRRIEALR
jgi:hypothetical protein